MSDAGLEARSLDQEPGDVRGAQAERDVEVEGRADLERGAQEGRPEGQAPPKVVGFVPSDEAYEKLRAYIEVVRSLMNLGFWSLKLSHVGPLDRPGEGDVVDYTAQIEPVDGRYLATMRFGEAFWRMTPEDQRETVVHELAHLYHVGVDTPLRVGAWRQQLGQGLYDHVVGEMKRGLEYATDHVAGVLAEYMPLPELPKADP